MIVKRVKARKSNKTTLHIYNDVRVNVLFCNINYHRIPMAKKKKTKIICSNGNLTLISTYIGLKCPMTNEKPSERQKILQFM